MVTPRVKRVERVISCYLTKRHKEVRSVPDKTRYLFTTFALSAEKYRVLFGEEEQIRVFSVLFSGITKVPFELFLGTRTKVLGTVLSELQKRGAIRTETRHFCK